MACLVHDAGVAAGAAEIALLHDAQLVAEVLADGREAGLVGRVLIALVGHDDRVDDLADLRVGGQRLEGGDGVGRTVERRDADRDARLGGGQLVARVQVGFGCGVGVAHDGRGLQDLPLGRLGGIPASGVDGGFGLAGQVEPDPAAVFEGGQGDGELRGTVALFVDVDVRAGDGDAGAVDLGAVDVHAGLAGQLDAQLNLVQLGPAAPVGGGEGIEVCLEGDLRAGRNAALGARQRGDAAGGRGLVFHDVEAADVARLAPLRQDDAGEAGIVKIFAGVSSHMSRSNLQIRQ